MKTKILIEIEGEYDEEKEVLIIPSIEQVIIKEIKNDTTNI